MVTLETDIGAWIIGGLGLIGSGFALFISARTARRQRNHEIRLAEMGPLVQDRYDVDKAANDLLVTLERELAGTISMHRPLSNERHRMDMMVPDLERVRHSAIDDWRRGRKAIADLSAFEEEHYKRNFKCIPDPIGKEEVTDADREEYAKAVANLTQAHGRALLVIQAIRPKFLPHA